MVGNLWNGGSSVLAIQPFQKSKDHFEGFAYFLNK
jgi:hypothetical protein